MGAVVQANGVTVEDRSWLRPAKDVRHINIAELDAVIKALNLVTKWPAKRVVLRTDSRTVYAEIEKETFRRQRHHQSVTDDGVDAETSLSLSLHLYLSSPPLHFILTLTFGQ